MELVEDRAIQDRTLGTLHIQEVVDNDTRSFDRDIVAVNKVIGTLSMSIQSYDDPMYL